VKNTDQLTADEKAMIAQYVDALVAKLTNDFQWIDDQITSVKNGISKITLITSLEEQKYRLYLQVGNALIDLKQRTDAAGIPWKEIYCNQLKLSETNQRRWRTVAKANVDERYYGLGFTRMFDIIKSVRDVDDSLDINDILKSDKLKPNQDINYEMEARCLAMHKVIENDPKVSELNVTNSLLKAIVDTKTITSGEGFNDVISDTKKRDPEERDTYLRCVLASATKNHDVNQPKKESDDEGIISIMNRLIGRLEDGTQELIPDKTIKRLIIALEKRINT